MAYTDDPLRRSAGARTRSIAVRPKSPARILVAALVLSVAATQAARASQRIVGRVVLGSKLADRRARFALYPDVNRAKIPTSPRTLADELANVVVYVESVPAGAISSRPAAKARIVRQEDLTFAPHVTPVVKGESVLFLNADPLFHNVFSLSRAATFDLGRYPSGKSKSVTFALPGVVKVFCHIHSDMSAVVFVLDNPFFATPDREGRFSLEPLPPGDYHVVAWHERATPVSKRVHVEAGRDTEVEFDVPLTEKETDGE